MKWLGASAAAALGVVGLLLLVLVLAVAGRLPGLGPLDPSKIPAAYVAAIQEASASCDGVPAAVLAAQLYQESRWDPLAVSPVGAIGLAQFMPATWKAYGVDGDRDGRADPRNPIDAIWSAAGYDCVLKKQVDELPGDLIRLTLAAYNAGPYAVLKHKGVPPYPETRTYVAAILASFTDYLGDPGGSADGLTPAAAHVRDVVISTFGVDDIGGYATGGHTAGSDHYTGRALDVMLTPLGPENTELGWRIALYLQSNARTLGIKYLIWQARIWSVERADEGWRPYGHPSGGTNPTLLHMDHVHISVY